MVQIVAFVARRCSFDSFTSAEYRHFPIGKPNLTKSPDIKEISSVIKPEHSPTESDTVSPRPFTGTLFASFGYPNFFFLLMGQVAHSGALWADMVARPLLVLALTNSPTHLGLIMATRTIPSFSFGLLAGVAADMFDRRTVILISKSISLVLGSIFALLLITNMIELWHVYLFTFLRGVTGAFDQPARRALIPTIVPPNIVTNAMALSSGSMQAMRIGGAAGAGLIIALSGINATFICIVILYAVAVIFTWLMKTPDHKRTGYRGIREIASDLMEGLRFATNNVKVRGLLTIAAGYYIFAMAFMMVFAPLFAINILEIGDEGFGYLMSITGIGGVIGTLVIAAVNPSRNRGIILVFTVVAVGLLQIMFAGSTYLGSITLTFVIVAISGFVQSIFLPIINAILISTAPEDMRGRAISLLSLDRSLMTLGAAIGGFTATLIGVQMGQIIFGLGCILSGLTIAIMFPSIRRLH